MRLVVAIGGNALVLKAERPNPTTQAERLEVAALAVSEVAGADELIVTHGNGPQVGHLALLEALGRDGELPLGMDVLTAQTEGWIGYLLEDAIAGVRAGPIATILTRVEVDVDDPAFAEPTKPIGPTYTRSEVARVREAHGWPMRRQGDGWRRVVASPEPRRVMGIEAIELLVRHGVTVIAGGGGGIPVAIVDGKRRGVEAVIDKDLTSALLAIGLGADHLAAGADQACDGSRARRPPLRRRGDGTEGRGCVSVRARDGADRGHRLALRRGRGAARHRGDHGRTRVRRVTVGASHPRATRRTKVTCDGDVRP